MLVTPAPGERLSNLSVVEHSSHCGGPYPDHCKLEQAEHKTAIHDLLQWLAFSFNMDIA